MYLFSSADRRRISRLRRQNKSLLFFEQLEDRLLLTVAELFGGTSLNPTPRFVPGEIIIGLERGGAGFAEVGQMLERLTPGGSHSLESSPAEAGAAPRAHITLAEDADVLEVARQLAQLDGVAYAEPNYIVSIDVIPNDASFSSLWGLNNTGQTGGTSDADIDAPETWDTQTGSLETVVGVIDTGIDYRHPDLYRNIWLNQGEIPASILGSLVDIDADNLFTFVDLNDATNSSLVSDLNSNGYIDGGDLLADPAWEDGIDEDGNNYRDDLVGWDFVNNDNDPFDDHSHGTHVSGTIGAVGNNSIGVAGVNWQVRLMGLKFLDASGSGNTDDAISAVYYATAAGANLTNNSWGGGGYSQGMYDAIAASGSGNMLFVAAAGNDGLDNDFFDHYPSGYDLNNVIGVAATDSNDEYASFSNYGATSVDLAAPGVGTLSTIPGASYASYSGTSMATPHVSGAAALLWSENPNLTNSSVKQALLDSVDPLPGSSQLTLTDGRLNLFNALNSFEDDAIPPADVTDLAATGSTLTTVGLTWTATGDDGQTGTATAYDVRYSTSPISEANWAAATQAVGEPAPQAVGANENFVVGNLTQSTGYYFAVKVLDNVGNASGISNVLLASTAAGTVVFEDDFESGPGAWVETGLWHQSVNRSNSPTFAWYYGQELVWNYDTGVANSGTLTSPPIDLSGTDEATLSFLEWSEVESSTEYDRTRVQLSNDGTSWNTVFESHGTSGTWAQRTIDLADYVGSSVQLRYFFETIDNGFNNFEGWYIDDVKVVAAAGGPAINVTPTSGLETTEAGGQASFNVVLTSAPTDSVTIDIASSDPTEGTVSPAQLVFSASDWNLPQTVTITGVDDTEGPTLVDGDITYAIVTAPAISGDLDYAGLNASDVSVTNLDFDTVSFQIEHGVITVPGSGFTVQLDNTYISPVVITTPNYTRGDAPGVVRLDNVTATSFDVRVVNPTGAAISGVDVYYVVVEEGAYSLPGGIQVEAFKFDSSVVDAKSSWTGHERNFENSYQTPVVLGQVMSSNDPDWSVFWSRGTSSQTAPPSGTSFRAGLHVGEDSDKTRASETIGYLVLDAGSGELNGIAFESGVGADIVAGMDNAPPYTYSLASLTAPDTAIVSQVAMDGNDGSWALLYGDTPLGTSSIQIAVDEDQLSDSERSHTTEQAAYLVLKDTGPPLPTLSISDVSVTEGDNGTFVNADFTVTLSATPGQDVTVNYATGDGSATSGADYTAQSSSLTFAAGTATLTQTISVVVRGDLLDELDETFSVTLSSPTNATIADGSGAGTILDDDGPPSLSIDDVSVTEGNSGTTNAVFTVGLSAISGKAVTVAYATSNGSAIAGQDYVATSGTLTIPAGSAGGTISVPINGDMLDEPDETYSLTLSSPTNATIADGSGAGTILDDDAPAMSGPQLYITVQTSGSDWQVVSLPHSYVSMVVVGTPNYDRSTAAAVVRVRQAVGNSFSFMVQRTSDGAPLSGIPVHFLVIEEGVYQSDPALGTATMEAVRYTSSVTDRAGSWQAELRSYQQAYAAPVVVGQVMSDNDSDWSVFWSRGGSQGAPPSSTVLRTGKHVGEDVDQTRANEIIGYVVMETGYFLDGTPNGSSAFSAAVGGDTVFGVENAPPYSYAGHPALSLSSVVIASQTGMDGNDGGWSVLYGSDPVSELEVHLAIDEDQAKDSERRHTSEQVAYIAFELNADPPPPAAPPALASLAAGSQAVLGSNVLGSNVLGSNGGVAAPLPVGQPGPEPALTSGSETETTLTAVPTPAQHAARGDLVRVFGELDGVSREEWNSELFGELTGAEARLLDESLLDDLVSPARRR